MDSNAKNSGSDIEKVIFVLRDKKTREANSEEISQNRIPPDAMEVVVIKRDGTQENFFPSPMGL